MKFKKGDRVIVNKCTSADFFGRKLDGKVGTVIEHHKSGDWELGIQFDECVDGHSCEGIGEWGYCWWVLDSECDLIDTTPFEERVDRVNYYTGKVVCVEDGMNLVKVGRLFNVVDGVAKYKNVPLTKTPITSVDDLNSRFGFVKFIEVFE